jgi:hypothetical protein
MFFLTHFPPKEKNFELHMSLVATSIPFGLMFALQFINPLIYTIIYCVICLKFTGMIVVYTVAEKKHASIHKRTDEFMREYTRLKIFAWCLLFFFFSCWIFPSAKTLAMFITIAFSSYYPILIMLEGFSVIQMMREKVQKPEN